MRNTHSTIAVENQRRAGRYKENPINVHYQTGDYKMSAQTAKQEAMDTIQRLPESVDFEEIVYRLHVLNQIHQGLKNVEEGRFISSEELKREIEQW